MLFMAIRVIDVCGYLKKGTKMSNKYNYNLEGAERKAFVSAVSEILGEPAVYQRAPSFSYQIGCYSVSKTGVLSCSDEANSERLGELVRELEGRGYTAEADNTPESIASTESAAQTNEAEHDEVETEDAETEDVETERTIAPEPENTERENSLTIELPLDDFDEEAYFRLTQIISSKETLLKKALGADDLSVVIKEGMLVFPWFTLHDIEGEAEAYTRFVTALVKMAKTQKRVTAKAKDITNDKFTMRLFLIRLGFIGEEYKTARKILLSNLTGNSSWKAGKPPERPQEARVEGETEPAAPAVPASAEAPETETIQTENTNHEGDAPYDKE